MLNLNEITLAGNLTRDPSLKHTPAGMAICEMSLAINERQKNGEQKTVFIDVKAWGNQAENCSKYLTKGANIYVKGKINIESWDDKDTGKKRYKTNVIAFNVRFVSTPANGNNVNESVPQNPNNANYGQPQQVTQQQNANNGGFPQQTPVVQQYQQPQQQEFRCSR